MKRVLLAFIFLSSPCLGLDNDVFTRCLLHFDTPGTSFVDYSGIGNPVTSGGGAVATTTNAKFGAACLYLDGVDDYIQITDPTFEPNIASFTVDFWVYPITITSSYLCGKSDPTAGKDWDIRFDGSGQISVVGVNGWAVNMTATSAVSLNSWQHVELDAGNVTCKLYVNGSLAATCARQKIQEYNTNSFRIGLQSSFGGGIPKMYLDEFRFSSGVLRHTGNFTPPAAAYSDATATVTLTGNTLGFTTGSGTLYFGSGS